MTLFLFALTPPLAHSLSLSRAHSPPPPPLSLTFIYTLCKNSDDLERIWIQKHQSCGGKFVTWKQPPAGYFNPKYPTGYPPAGFQAVSASSSVAAASNQTWGISTPSLAQILSPSMLDACVVPCYPANASCTVGGDGDGGSGQGGEGDYIAQQQQQQFQPPCLPSGVERPSKMPKLEQAQPLQHTHVEVPNRIQDAPVPPAEDSLEQDV